MMKNRGSLLGRALLAAGLGVFGFGGCASRTLVGDVPDSGGAGQGGALGTVSDAGGSPDGNGNDGGGTCTPPVDPGDQPFSLPTTIGGNVDSVAGTWTGYFEAYNLPSGSDMVKLTLEEGTAGSSARIHVTLGADVPPPAATDPAAFYPPGTDPARQIKPIDFIEGFPYDAHSVMWQGDRLTFKIAGYEAWGGWCALQASYAYPAGSDSYNCMPGGGGGVVQDPGGPDPVCSAEDGNGHVIREVPCAQFYLCSAHVCACDACGCSAALDHTASFDITFSNTSASGATDGLGKTLKLTRNVH